MPDKMAEAHLKLAARTIGSPQQGNIFFCHSSNCGAAGLQLM
jgi:hypothetical protein